MCRIARALNGKIQVELLPKAVDCLLLIFVSFGLSNNLRTGSPAKSAAG